MDYIAEMVDWKKSRLSWHFALNAQCYKSLSSQSFG
jgi:hypothetical protein